MKKITAGKQEVPHPDGPSPLNPEQLFFPFMEIYLTLEQWRPNNDISPEEFKRRPRKTNGL